MVDLKKTLTVIDQTLAAHGQEETDPAFEGLTMARGFLGEGGCIEVARTKDGVRLVIDENGLELPILEDGSTSCTDRHYLERMTGLAESLQLELDKRSNSD